MEFVYKHLDHKEYPDLVEPVKVIGGRLTDLEMFVQKVKSGMNPNGNWTLLATEVGWERQRHCNDALRFHCCS